MSIRSDHHHLLHQKLQKKKRSIVEIYSFKRMLLQSSFPLWNNNERLLSSYHSCCIKCRQYLYDALNWFQHKIINFNLISSVLCSNRCILNYSHSLSKLPNFYVLDTQSDFLIATTDDDMNVMQKTAAFWPGRPSNVSQWSFNEVKSI